MTATAVAPLFVLAVAWACASTPQPRQVRHVAERDTALLPIVVRKTNSAGISGIVRDQLGKPVPWAHIALFGMHAEALADAHGRFSMKLAPGTYKLWTKRIGYHARTDSIQVPRVGGLYLELRIRENTHPLSPMSSDVSGRVCVRRDVRAEPIHRQCMPPMSDFTGLIMRNAMNDATRHTAATVPNRSGNGADEMKPAA